MQNWQLPLTIPLNWNFLFYAFVSRCSDAYSDTMLGYANSIRTIDGGTHIDGMKASLTRTLNNLGKKSKIIKVHSSSHTISQVIFLFSFVFSFLSFHMQCFESQIWIYLLSIVKMMLIFSFFLHNGLWLKLYSLLWWLGN